MLLWLRLREPGEITRVLAALADARRWSGVTGMLGSLGWFVAFTLQNAAYVRALGQVELVFSVLGGLAGVSRARAGARTGRDRRC